ncbi:ornithine cyclodeaminase family protein [Synergistaceae bacterium OttesenSCG-928-I11]|nr:ornithine cyclodeaminase family protein [Synergistaceae bacterium OttesenSCG-928-I11]
MPVTLINADEVKKLLTMKDTVEACELAFTDWGNGVAICPTKITLELGEDADWPTYKNGLNAMPAYIHSQKSAGIKCVGGSLNNPANGLPYIIALILLFDPATGIFRCIMDGEQITNYRTGAQAAVAAKYLVNEKSFDMGLYGAGAQGRTQLLAFSEVFDIRKVKVYDVNPEAAKKYAAEMSKATGIEIVVMEKPEDVCRDVTIVVSVTHGRDKFIKNEWIKPGQIVFPMGSFTECDDALLLGADRVIVDSIGQTMHRGSLKSVVDQGKFTEDMITATIGEVVTGKKGGHIKPTERIVCIPIGTGAMDVAVATAVFEKAKKQGIGAPFVFNENVEI